jgi:hypothetical protein
MSSNAPVSSSPSPSSSSNAVLPTTEQENESFQQIALPSLEYGYRATRLEWSELKDIILVEKNLAKLTRSVEQQTEYELFKRRLGQTWRSVLDYILCTKFQVEFERRVDAATGLGYAYPPLMMRPKVQQEEETVQKIVVHNDFPYYMAENVQHDVLWKLHGICSDADIQQAKEQVQQELVDGGGVVLDCLHWINPPHLKSLPDIDHVHILCLLQVQRHP